jgi:CHAT domain-containing protein/Flp pilus assembly protein TadD
MAIENEPEARCRRELETIASQYGREHPDYARALNELAELYRESGRYEQAERTFLEALDLYRSSLGRAHRETGYALNNLAILYRTTGQYALAEKLYHEATAIFRRSLPAGHPDLAIHLNNLALLYDSAGLYDLAQPLYQEAIGILEAAGLTRDLQYAHLLNNVGLLYCETGEPEKAVPLLQRAVGIRRRLPGGSPLFGISLGNAGVALQRLGRLDEAEAALVEAVAVVSGAWGPDHPVVLGFRMSLGVLQQTRGQIEAAETTYRETLAGLRRAFRDLHPAVGKGLTNLAMLCARTGRPREALALVQEALKGDEQRIEQVFSVSSDRHRVAMLQTARRNFDLLLSIVRDCLQADPDAVSAAADAVLRRKRLATEAWRFQEDQALADHHPELRDLIEQRRRLTTLIARAAMAGLCSREADPSFARLSEGARERDEVEAELARRLQGFDLVRRLEVVDARAVAAALPPDATLVEFIHFLAYGLTGESSLRYAAFVVRRDAPPRMIDLGEAAEIESAVEKFRRYTLTGTEADQVTAGLALRAAVFDPLLATLGGARKLLLAPDGALLWLPFDALPTEQGDYLVDEGYRITYLSTGRDLLRSGVSPLEEPGPALVVADPDFELAAPDAAPGTLPAEPPAAGLADSPACGLHRSLLATFAALPGTREEGREVAKHLGVRPLLREQALEGRVKGCSSPRVIHLATHGFFLAGPEPEAGEGLTAPAATASAHRKSVILANPLLRAGLALAGANTWQRGGRLPAEAEDGILTAEDVRTMDLSGTRLAVLSACDTGLGVAHGAEGALGLRRAFVMAGANTLVVSLWKVDDEATRLLMGELYRHLAAGQSVGEALHRSKQSLRANPVYGNPYFWAPFVLQGDPRSTLV